jgi:hypothetical protein
MDQRYFDSNGIEFFPLSEKGVDLYTLTVYLDEHKVCEGTINGDCHVSYLSSQADEWVGKDNWNRLETSFYKHN